MSIRVIVADSSHDEAICMIGKQAFRHAFGQYFDDQENLVDYLDYTYETDKIRRSIEKDNNLFFLVLVDEVPVGFAKVKKASLNEQIESIAQMELQKIYVLPYYHGSGAGPALMRAVLELADNVRPDYIWLDTLTTNTKAIRFYERNGFKKTGKHYFMIGAQTFEYHLMSLAVNEMAVCN